MEQVLVLGQFGFAWLRNVAMSSPFLCQAASARCVPAPSWPFAALTRSTAIEMCSLSSVVSFDPAGAP